MKRVLIGYDGSPQSEGALEELSRAGLPSEVDAMVMTVADVWLPANPDSASDSFPATDPGRSRQARERAAEAVASASTAAAKASGRLQSLNPKWKVGACSCADSPAWGILHKAVEWKADLIVMGSHGRSTLERLFLGSVSQKVAAEATCSVRIARLSAIRPDRLRVVVAVDGSSDSQLAVGEVARRVWAPYCEFHVVAVIDPRMESTLAWPGQGRAWEPVRDEELRDAVARLVEKDSRILYDAGLKVETHILSGDAKRELLSHAATWEADCIFIGARGMHHGGRLSFGTTASAVTGRAHCSVEIVRPD